MPTPKRHQDSAARQRAYRRRRKLARLSATDRKKLPSPAALPTMPSAARWKALRERIEDDLQTLFDEMESYRDERSEAWQDGDKGQAFQEILDRVESAIAAVEDIM